MGRWLAKCLDAPGKVLEFLFLIWQLFCIVVRARESPRSVHSKPVPKCLSQVNKHYNKMKIFKFGDNFSIPIYGFLWEYKNKTKKKQYFKNNGVVLR